jgi:ABC-type uncharacterized transport system substrate-binding protein
VRRRIWFGIASWAGTPSGQMTVPAPRSPNRIGEDPSGVAREHEQNVLLLADPSTHRESRPALNTTAQALGLSLREAGVSTPDEIERALRGARESDIAGVNVLSSALLFALRGRIVSLAAELGLPAIYQWPETAEEGGLIAYGPSLLGAFRQVVSLVAKVLDGGRPGDLPVEQPTRCALFVNLATANALDLTVPPSILVRADKAIE